jgi:hypothetical protein
MVRGRAQARLDSMAADILGRVLLLPDNGSPEKMIRTIVIRDIVCRKNNMESTFSSGSYLKKHYKTMDEFIEIADALFDQLE